MKLESEKGDTSFSVFMRILVKHEEVFSIGLVYLPRDDEPVCLLRCNGDHGPHTNKVREGFFKEGVHVHQVTEEAIFAGIKPEHFAQLTDKYADYYGALRHFVKIVNITNYQKYLSSAIQKVLPFSEKV